MKSGKPPLGPGPNYFSDSDRNVWLDNKKQLHLKITQKNGIWYCAEVDAVKSLGYGKYIFHLAGKIDQLDRNIVLGLFTYDCRSPDAEKVHYREIDFEFGTFGKTDQRRVYGLLSICPGYVKGNRINYDIRMGQDLSTHSFAWTPGSVSFQSVEGDGADAKEIFSWNYTGPAVNRPGLEVPMVNLWLWGGKPPVEGKELEIIVRKFEFVPIQK
ncbi:MAG: glycoside hydrolase family 16 protein [Verrucomicrobia bacterium]|nr:glycoside hydrolase family 16 protein [Verrucomicrobiota bacterium]MBU4291756.1 glycoside hydrolase family 16 protein [Verrucomicrobiota bacterium]MBU4428600.1 glycoside hydrolase family 16 protein [Verrucomicrobiota bacterium]MCG2679346.1 glycoside hydrolase family 16 protein [Kiritimatiellia bacterium]